MKMSEIQAVAKERGVKPERRTKVELVRCLQRNEGFQDCFQTGQVETCGQPSCLWREDCA